MNDIVKICKTHGELTKKDVYIHNKYLNCAICIRIRVKKRREENLEKVRKYQRDWSKKYRAENKEKMKEYSKNLREKNIDKFLERTRKYREKNREKLNLIQLKYKKDNKEKIKEKRKKDISKLSDGYIRKLIIDDSKILRHKDIPNEMLDIKRQLVILKRKIKELKDDK